MSGVDGSIGCVSMETRERENNIQVEGIDVFTLLHDISPRESHSSESEASAIRCSDDFHPSQRRAHPHRRVRAELSILASHSSINHGHYSCYGKVMSVRAQHLKGGERKFEYFFSISDMAYISDPARKDKL